MLNIFDRFFCKHFITIIVKLVVKCSKMNFFIQNICNFRISEFRLFCTFAKIDCFHLHIAYKFRNFFVIQSLIHSLKPFLHFRSKLIINLRYVLFNFLCIFSDFFLIFIYHFLHDDYVFF